MNRPVFYLRPTKPFLIGMAIFLAGAVAYLLGASDTVWGILAVGGLVLMTVANVLLLKRD